MCWLSEQLIITGLLKELVKPFVAFTYWTLSVPRLSASVSSTGIHSQKKMITIAKNMLGWSLVMIACEYISEFATQMDKISIIV